MPRKTEPEDEAGPELESQLASAVEEQEAPPSEPVLTWRDTAKEAGLDLSEYEDDSAAWKAIASQVQSAESARQEAEQLKELAQWGRHYVANAADFSAWQQERQAASQKPVADPFAPPEYDDRWLSMVKRNEAGEIIPDTAAGGTPEIVSKLLNHYQWQRSFQSNPHKYLEGFVDRRAEERAKALVAEEVSRVREELAAQQFIVTNRDWLFAKDKTGQPVYANGQQQLSEDGQAFSAFLQQAQGMGLNSQQQQAYGMNMLGLWRQRQTTTPTQKKEKFLKDAANFGAQASGSIQSNGTQDNSHKSVADMLAAAYAAQGVEDSVFAST